MYKFDEQKKNEESANNKANTTRYFVDHNYL